MKFLALTLLLSSSLSFADTLCKSKKENHKGHYILECSLKTDSEDDRTRHFTLDAYRSTHGFDGVTDAFSKAVVEYQNVYFEFYSAVNLTSTAYMPTAQVADGARQFCNNSNSNLKRTLQFSDRIQKIASNDSRMGKKKYNSKWAYNGKTIELECQEAQR